MIKYSNRSDGGQFMRVISGSARGLKLNAPSDERVRPTTDRVKESMFNIISPYIYESKVLDLFSGSGALGIECISRGADFVYFCDKDKDSIKILRSNISKGRFGSKSEVILGDFRNTIKKLSDEDKKFDIIFIDPPYYENLFDETLDLIERERLLSRDGIIVVEHDAMIELKDFHRLKKFKERKYGITKLSFYQLEEEDGSTY